MIYVLASSAFIGNDLDEYETILKIGYCRDDREKKRTEKKLRNKDRYDIIWHSMPVIFGRKSERRGP